MPTLWPNTLSVIVHLTTVTKHKYLCYCEWFSFACIFTLRMTNIFQVFIYLTNMRDTCTLVWHGFPAHCLFVCLFLFPFVTILNSRVLLYIQLESGSTLTVRMDLEYLLLASDITPLMNTNVRLVGMVWHHVALVLGVGGTSITVYHNGALVGSLTINLTPGPLSAIYLAGSPDEPGSGSVLIDHQYYNGLVQDVGLYSRSLTNNEISLLAQGVISLSGASFLPQCLCPTNQVVTNDSQNCGESVTRYRKCIPLHSIA